MEEMIQGIMAKAGLSREQAEKVVTFLRENASKLPQWLGQSGGGLGEAAKNIPGL